MPYTFGDGEFDVDAFDYSCDADQPLHDIAPTPLDDIALSIGDRVARRVPDGATVQLGSVLFLTPRFPALRKRRGPQDLVGDGQ